MYDTFGMILFDIHDIFILIHHWLTISGIYISLLYNISGTDILMGYFIIEWSNPFLHLNEICKAMNLRHAKIRVYSEVVFNFIYLATRIPIGIPFVYYLCSSESSPTYIKLVAL